MKEEKQAPRDHKGLPGAREPQEARELLEPWAPKGALGAVEQWEAKERLELKVPKVNPALTLTGSPAPMSRMATIISTLAFRR